MERGMATLAAAAARSSRRALRCRASSSTLGGSSMAFSRGHADDTSSSAPSSSGGSSSDVSSVSSKTTFGLGGGGGGGACVHRFESTSVELGLQKTESSVGFETGRLARLTDGAVLASMGDSRVLCAAVAAREPDPNAGFFPLTVDYRERLSAFGKIPNTFTRREGAPKDREVLAMRVMDRAVRPLFPKDFRTDTSVQAIVLATDRSQDPAVLAVNGASAALSVSSIPWGGPVGAVRVSITSDGQTVINPTDEEAAAGEFTLTYAGNEQRTLMIEAAAMQPRGVPEATVAAALRAAHAAAAALIPPQRRLAAAVGKPKVTVPAPTEDVQALKAKVMETAGPRLLALYKEEIQSKSARGKAMADLKVETGEALRATGLEFTDNQLDSAYLWVSSRVMRDLIFDEKVRVDGRGLRQLRELAAEVKVMPVVHGSSLFERGNTQALSTVTIGTLKDQQRMGETPIGPDFKRLMLHYSFPSFSINETPRRGGLSRREIGHGALAEKSLAGMLPSDVEWPFSVRINAETLESNGSSSMAAVCSGSLALMDAGVPIKEHVGAISVGLVMDEDEQTGEVTRHELLSDIMGLEDVLGDMDFKIAGTRGGITGIQLDCKPAGIPLDILIEALGVASEARQTVIDKMEAAIPSHRVEDDMSDDQQRFARMEMDKSFLGKLIGPRGSNMEEIETSTGCSVSLKETPGETTAIIGIFAPNRAALEACRKLVEKVNAVVVAGNTYEGKVVEVLPFGWIVEILDTGDRGLVHVTEYSHAPGRIETSDHWPVGEAVEVKVLEVEPNGGKIRLSRKALEPAPAGGLPRPKTPLGRGARGVSAGVGGGGTVASSGAFVRNPDGSLKKPLERVKADAKVTTWNKGDKTAQSDAS